MSAAIKFTCPHCERVCKVPAELGGKQGRCPGCRKGLEVPTETPEHLLSGRQPAAPSEEPSPAEEAPEPAEQKQPSARRTTARQSLIPKRTSGRAKRRSGRNRRRSSLDQLTFEETGPILCKACKLDVPAGAIDCPHCGIELRKEVRGGLHWAIPVSFLFMILLPLIGLFFAQLGLRRARQRNSYENLAWVSVFLNGANLTFGILYMLRGLLGE